MILRIALYVIAAILIAAHFLRAGDFVLMALCLAAPALFFVRKSWSLWLLQAFSYAAAAIWVVTAWQLAQQRLWSHENWLRPSIILGAVAAFTVLAGLLLNSKRLRARYPA